MDWACLLWRFTWKGPIQLQFWWLHAAVILSVSVIHEPLRPFWIFNKAKASCIPSIQKKYLSILHHCITLLLSLWPPLPPSPKNNIFWKIFHISKKFFPDPFHVRLYWKFYFEKYYMHSESVFWKSIKKIMFQNITFQRFRS